MESKPLSGKNWDFVHNLASKAAWTPGLRAPSRAGRYQGLATGSSCAG